MNLPFLGDTSASVECSWRYGVVGAYRDRGAPLLRLYPCPFVRISIAWRL